MHQLLFNEEQLAQDFEELDLKGRMELRIRLAPYILQKTGVGAAELHPDGPLFIEDL